MSDIGLFWKISWIYRLTLKPGHDSCVIISNNLRDAFIKVKSNDLLFLSLNIIFLSFLIK